MNQYPHPAEVYKSSLDPKYYDISQSELSVLESLSGLSERPLVECMDDLRQENVYK